MMNIHTYIQVVTNIEGTIYALYREASWRRWSKFRASAKVLEAGATARLMMRDPVDGGRFRQVGTRKAQGNIA